MKASDMKNHDETCVDSVRPCVLRARPVVENTQGGRQHCAADRNGRYGHRDYSRHVRGVFRPLSRVGH